MNLQVLPELPQQPHNKDHYEAAAPLDSKEQAVLDQITTGLKDPEVTSEPISLPAETETSEKPLTQSEVDTRPTTGSKNILRKLSDKAVSASQFVTAQAWATANVLGDKLSRKSAEQEESGTSRNLARVGVVAVAAVVPLLANVGRAVAAAKGMDIGGGSGSGEAHNVLTQSLSGNGSQKHEVANIVATHDTDKVAAPILSNSQEKNVAAPALLEMAKPKDVTVAASPEAVGDTWTMPKYTGPEDSVQALAEKQLKLAFQANGINPETVTNEQANILVDAFMKQNEIQDQGKMFAGDYKMQDFKGKTHDIVKELLTKQKEAADPATAAAALAPKIPAEALKDIDVKELPNDLVLPVKVSQGDGVYNLLENANVDPKQQHVIVDMLNQKEVTESLVKFAPESFYQYTYPEDYHVVALRGTNELRLKFHDGGQLLIPEQQKKINDMYHHIIEEITKRQTKKSGKVDPRAAI